MATCGSEFRGGGKGGRELCGDCQCHLFQRRRTIPFGRYVGVNIFGLTFSPTAFSVQSRGQGTVRETSMPLRVAVASLFEMLNVYLTVEHQELQNNCHLSSHSAALLQGYL